MSLWGKIVLVAAGGVLGAAATRFARTPGQDLSVRGDPAPGRSPRAGDWRSRLYRFAATVRAGMDEREAELRESFGVAAPRPSASRLAARDSAPPVIDGPAAPHGPTADPTDPPTDREGKHR
ncbi:hypothetical protein ACH9DO_00430 [Kocuria sp. M1N1S27]|uniref:hypothetical protein n=1 Tax=Kocuria kalidii TaxID=3376283 RepID=UPI0037B8C863